MELKPVIGRFTINNLLLLIVPYGIETDKAY